ncbi:acyloxyacyl hydrolase [Coraliomargarita sp. SDUM461004]|uniref:Acyloxyacyl hydrolase n=1 Tax=Thalassobacterium sedimentorum TaxID=3041258 RepID=A0ABU1AIA4_9BACT|nr:acyloxyacyl hydrolase [Coraliomargarita sp. SDUM461004]MDQ8194544.1 acyloxyacyl hydrolase [Coraliomargarita sp. SDUM461004]
MKTTTLLLTACCAITTSHLAAQNSDTLFSEIGLRFGQDAESQVDLQSYELYSTIDTEWTWDLSQNLRLEFDIETAIGGLSGEGENAFYARVAPVGQLHFGNSPISLEFSSGPSYYSEDRFDQYDIGGNFHFTSSIGFNWEFDEAWKVGYRFQHTSNANLDSPNPGLDMHTVSIAYIF